MSVRALTIGLLSAALIAVAVVGFPAFGAHAQLAAAVIALATGIPVSKIAEGGTYKVQREFLASGGVSGLAVAKFKARGLGTVWVSYAQRQGAFNQAQGFVPMFGTVKTVGGTGAAATWRISLSYKQTGVSGTTVEQPTYDGSERASVGKPKPMTVACRRVAAIRG